MYTPNSTPIRPFPLKPLAAAVLLVCASGIHSAPILDTPKNKDITVDFSVEKVTTVTQHADRTVVDWKEFSIPTGEMVEFLQNDVNSVILNRVVGGDVSQIFGVLRANGRVFLINPNGIVFGEKSVVSVGGLVASTLNVDDKFKFKNDKQAIEQLIEFKAETSSGKIENFGAINANDIVFLAPVINNTGFLNASGPGAAVSLIAASEVTANIGGADMVFAVKAGHENTLIDQLGSILVQGGKIVLLASSTNNGAGSVINTAGVNEASQIIVQGDTVQLKGAFTASNSENALQVSAKTIGQLEALTVAGSSQLVADEVKLGNVRNDFTGQVKLNVKGAAELQDINSLNISGKAGSLLVKANSIVQTDAVEVQNATSLTANTVTLNNTGNDFKGQVDVATTGYADLRDANTLILNNLNAGSLTANATSIGQTTAGTVEVQGATSLTANTVTLNNTGNDFKGQVDVATTGHADLRDANTLTLNKLNAGSLTANATSIGQTTAGTVEVQGATSLTANTVTLNNTGNDFKGQVDVATTGHADLRDANTLTLNTLNAGSLAVNATSIGQTAAGTAEVQGATSLTANTVTLNNTGNDFKDQVSLTTSIDANLRDINDLTVTGDVNKATLEGDTLLINGLRAAGDLTLKAASIDQNAGLANALAVQGETRIEARVKNTGSVNLNNADNDFVRKVDFVDVGEVTLFDKNSLFVEGHAGVLTVKATSVEQNGSLEVDNTTRINAASVLLNNSENDFKGLVDLNVSGQATVHDANTLRLAGNANDAILNTDRIEINGLLNVAENLTLSADDITQSAALTVGGLTSIDGTQSAVLENTGNDFGGQVNLKNKANAVLRDKNKITVAGSAASLTVNAPMVTPGEVTLGDLTANSLTVNAAVVNQVNPTQAEKVIVEGVSTFNAGKIVLLNDRNDFKGQVNFAVTDQVTLHDANDLLVAGNIKSATIDAQTLTLNGLSASADLALTASSISDGQDGAVLVSGTSTLQGGSVTLDNSGNRFENVVNLDLSGAAAVHSSENLEMAGKAASVSASAGEILTVSSLTSETIVLEGKQVQLNGFSTAGNLTLKGSDITQRGALTVDGVTTLAAAKVTLDDAGNDFKNTVVLNSAGDVKIQDANSVVLQGTVNKLTAKAVADVNQAAALAVTKTSDITAANINLNNNKNVFGDTVKVNATQVATVHSDQNLTVGANADTLNVVAGENLSLSSTTVGTLNATGKNINQAKPTDTVQVNGKSILTAQQLHLQNASNDFKGTLELAVTGKADIVDGNDLFLSGRAQTLNATVGGTLTAGDLDMGNGTLAASTIQMNQLNVLDAARLQANTVTQTEANQSGGEITIAARTVNLALENDFKGNVILENVGTATIHDNNKLVLSGDANTLTVKAEHVKQSAELKVTERTNLNAESVELANVNNDFEGVVDLQVKGKALLRDANGFTVQGNAGDLTVEARNTATLGDLQAGVLNVTADVLKQSPATVVDVVGKVVLNTNTANLTEEGNTFGGAVVLNGGNNTLHTTGDLTVEGRSAQLNVKAKNLAQSDILTVTGAATLSADAVALFDGKNDFQKNVNATVAGNVAIQDQNDLSVSGSMQQLDVIAGKALQLKNLATEVVKAQAEQIELNNAASSKSVHLNSRSVTQGGSLSFNGETTIQATSVTLDNENNDFGGVLNLSATEFAEVADANTLTLGGAQGGGVLKLTAQSVSQGETSNPGASVNHSGDVEVTAANVQLNRVDNDFSGRLTVNSDNAIVVDSNSLSMDFVGRDLSATANKLVIDSIQASGNIVLTAETADVSSTLDLSIQGNVGDLTVQANRLTQTDELTVRNRATLKATTVDLMDDANDFQGEVVLNVSGSTKLNDANTLVVSGHVNGPTTLKAESIQQVNALSAESSLTLHANQIALDNNANALNGLVRIEGKALTNKSTLRSQGKLAVEGANISNLKLVAKEAVLGDLGELQQLDVTAGKVTQSAALQVQQQTLLNADSVTLEDSNNDFAGEVLMPGKDSSVLEVSIADKNSLNIQATDVTLAAQVKGDFNLKAQNVVLNTTTVAGRSNINLTGALTQKERVNLQNAALKADSIELTNRGNRFGGTTQLDSGKTIQMSTAGDLNADQGLSTGALSLKVGGNTTVKGTQVVFAQSRLDGKLEVNANGISQTDSLHVDGAVELNAVGGTISLQHANNRFQNTVSATAEQTDIVARGDLRVMNLMSRGGQITADGQLLLLGNVEQTGGTLTFTAKGASRPLSSADIAMLLPPALDVFSAKEVVDPITGLGRITLASPAIYQQSGQILTAAGSMTQFNSTENGSVVLAKNNQINGQFAALSGEKYGQAYSYAPQQGAGLFAVNNEVQLRVAGMGVEADVVAIRARGLSTTGEVSQIRARMPYNDISAGTSRSFAGLTLSIPTGNSNELQGGAVPFGESSGVGQSAVAGAIRVEVGELNRAGFGGFVTVLPFEGNNLLPGQVVYLAGPERKGKYAFFYDGARSLNRVPVVYNGSLLLSPQESAALTTAQGAVVLARQEQTRSVVRTENVAGKIINGVVLEVGPGRPATEGTGGAGKPASCDAAEEGLSCNP